ncbi:MAG: GNAT family N-acetyltransferase [Candidatus Omnitrophica bacterium]|nr:GNAT family N-acetyltransferase [Candidatus Omnitrophota bacterium]
MEMRFLTLEDRPLLERLLRENPYKEIQVAFQRLDPEKTVQFHADRILRQATGPDSPVWVCQAGNRTGILGIQPSETHSQFFGFSIFSIEPILTYNLRTPDKEEALQRVGDVLEAKGARLVWARCDENEGDLNHCLVQVGGEYCGATVRLSRWLSASPRPEGSPNFRVRAVQDEDRPALRDLARANHTHSHFLRDPNLPRERKPDVFPAYLDRCFGHKNRPFLVAEDSSGKVVGFSLLLCPEGQEQRLGQTIGIVDFIAVDESAQGKGVGAGLLAESFDLMERQGYRLVELKTMLDNVKGIQFYQKYGFRMLSAELHFSIGGRSGRWP